VESLPATSENVKKVEESAKRDLAWFVADGIATSIAAVASIPGLDQLSLQVAIVADGRVTRIKFIENWKAII